MKTGDLGLQRLRWNNRVILQPRQFLSEIDGVKRYLGQVLGQCGIIIITHRNLSELALWPEVWVILIFLSLYSYLQDGDKSKKGFVRLTAWLTPSTT